MIIINQYLFNISLRAAIFCDIIRPTSVLEAYSILVLLTGAHKDY